jgi:DNA-binding MarR family transcriptional regulator
MRDRTRRPTPAPTTVRLDALSALLGYQLRRAQLAVFADFVAALEALDLRPATFSVLVTIEANPGLSQAAIADALGIQRANFVPLVAGLQKRGLVIKNASASDRRSHALQLTAEGRRLLKQAWVPVRAHERRIAARVGARGHRQLHELLHAMTGPQRSPA